MPTRAPPSAWGSPPSSASGSKDRGLSRGSASGGGGSLPSLLPPSRRESASSLMQPPRSRRDQRLKPVDEVGGGATLFGGMSTSSLASTERSFLPKGISQSLVQRMNYDAAFLCPAILDLRLNYGNLMNEMAQNKGQMVSHQFLMMRPQRKQTYKPPSFHELNIPQHLDQKARKKLAAMHRRRRRAEAAARRSSASLGLGFRRGSAERFKRGSAIVVDDDENLDVLKMQDSGSRELREKNFEIQVQQLCNESRVQDVYRALGTESGMPRHLAKRALKALGHAQPEPGLLLAAMRAVPGDDPLSLPDFAVVLNVFQRQRHLVLVEEFKSIDGDHTGKVDVREFRMMLWSAGFTLSDEAVLSIFNEVGAEHHGQVNVEEYRRARVLVEEHYGFTHQEVEEFMHAFDRCEPEKQGELNADELTCVLAYCGVRASRENVCAIGMDISDGLRASVPRAEFLRFLRHIMEQQIEQARVLFSEFDEDCGGTLSEHELKELFLRLGYHLSQVVLTECFKEVGELDEIVFEELLKVVHMVRAKEGFDADELQELTEVFVQETKTGQMREFELVHALDWLGYAISASKRFGISSKVDMGKTGLLEKKDFFKFMRLVREQEATVVQEVMARARADGHAINDEDIRAMLGKLNYAPASSVIHAAMQEHMRGELYPDLQALLAVVCFCRREQAVEARNCHGLSPMTTRKIGAKLSKRLGGGKSIDAHDVERLMQEMFPIVKESDASMVKLHRFIGEQNLGPNGHLHDIRVAYRLVRVYGDILAEDSWMNETAFVHHGYFTKSQVSHLRKSFMMVAGDVSARDLKAIISDIMSVDLTVDVEKVRSGLSDMMLKPPGAVDFASFLRVIHKNSCAVQPL
mmetsp:Transcript_34524/g.77459  ORF Transcript_34524/g.77459 Transcript_34524/m.77459 type:complete len:863 (+) Transcript_34524:81-2669(+)